MEISVLNSWNEVLPHKKVWNEILGEMSNDIVFTTLEWMYAWWEHLGSENKLFILMLTHEDETIGFCPLMKIPKKGYEEIKFIGGDEASTTGLIIKKKHKQKIIEVILDYLTSIKDRVLIDMHGLMKESELDEYNIIKAYLMTKDWSFLETSSECFYTEIDGQDFQSYINSRLGKRSMSTMGRKGRRLNRLGKTSFKPFDDKQENIENIFDIHDKRWKRKIGSSKFSEGKTREFFKALALSEDTPFTTSIDTININNRTIAFIYGFQYNGRYMFYRIGHDDDFFIFSPGEMVLREKIRDCFEKNLKIFDFGVGYEPYKAIWGANKYHIGGFVFPSNNIFSKLVKSTRRLKLYIRGSLKRSARLYHFVKYRLGKIKLLLYPENAMKARRSAFRRFEDRFRETFTFVYWIKHYYIMSKYLRHLQVDEQRAHRLEEGSIENLDLLLDISNMESSDILRRFLKGDKCILIYAYQDIHCLWFDLSTININEIGYSYTMDKKSAYLYEYYTAEKKKRIDENILHSIFVYLKGEGFNKLYLSVKKKDNIFIDLLQDKGFKGFRNLKSVKRFGKSTYKIED